MPDAPLTKRILSVLLQSGVRHRVLHHPPVLTSAEAAQVRGTPLEAGAKALVCRVDDRTVLIVVPANRRLDNRAFRHAVGARSVSMVGPDQVLKLVGAPVGAVPPFGSFFGLATYCDRAVVEREEIAFNVGSREVSVVMRGRDYADLESPTIGEFSGPSTKGR